MRETYRTNQNSRHHGNGMWKTFVVLFLYFHMNNEAMALSQIIGIGGVVDESDCYNDISASDVDGDNWMSQSEYVTFVSLQSDNYFSSDLEFDSLPEDIQMIFFNTAVCRDCSFADCCSPEEMMIDVEGSYPNTTPSDAQIVLLYILCSNTFSTIEILVTPTPTLSPIEESLVTPSPTLSPTQFRKASSTPSVNIETFYPSLSPSIIEEPEIMVTTLSPGAISGIAVAAAAVGMIILSIIYRRSLKKDLLVDRAESPPKHPPQSTPSNTLGASSPHYGPGATGSKVISAAPFSIPADDDTSKHSTDDLEKSDVESQASSSNAGSSGWSSSAGVSSMNTASVDSMEKDVLLGSNLATIGLHSSIAANRLASTSSKLQYVPEQNENEKNDLDSLSSGSDKLISTSPSVTRSDLDQAIEAGDWAAVGATAALLASSSESVSSRSYSTSPRSVTTRSSRGSLSSIDAERADELDRLVDSGDWEGVVLAAGKFSAESDTDGSKSETDLNELASPSSNTDPSGSSTNTYGTSSLASPSTGSFSIAINNKQNEIRSEVESLVRRVVPEELDNIDELMEQYTGREEELLETLRTMQERNIAQRARAEVQRSAKREARKARSEKLSSTSTTPDIVSTPTDKSTSSSGFPPLPPTPQGEDVTSNSDIITGAATAAALGGTAAVVVAAANSNKSTSSSQGSDHSTHDENEPIHKKTIQTTQLSHTASTDSTPKRDKSRSALELAIEAGDWEAVGEAAALMSDASVTTTDTMELQRLIETGYSSGTSDFETNSSLQRLVEGGYESGNTIYETASSHDDSIKSINLQRAAELDRLIDQGDWTGVVAAAGRFSSTDAHLMSSKASKKENEKPSWIITSAGESVDTSDSESFQTAKNSLTSKEKALQEEHDALAQAEIWMAIAAQSKQEVSAEAKGASDATDWAISRSLNALNEAELHQRNSKSSELESDEFLRPKSASVSEEDKSV